MAVFKDVVGFPGYLVSSDGVVWSSRVSVKGKHGPRKARARALRAYGCGKNRNYMGVSLSIDGAVSRKRVAHLVAEAFIGPRPPGCDVDHIDGNTRNNSIGNLRYLSSSLNRGRRHG